MNQFTMPYQQEQEAESKKGGSSPRGLWKPLPDKAGIAHTNNVLIPLFSPHHWRLFNPTLEMVQKYGMTGDGANLAALDPANPINTFYFKLPVHNVQNFTRPDGSSGYATVLCPIETNKYLVDSLGRGPLFAQPVRCPFCEEEQRHWDTYNSTWETCGTDKKSLSKEGYWQFVDNHPVLSASRKSARDMQAVNKYVIMIFDHDKFLGVRQRDEGEESVSHQIWFAPKTVHTKLLNLFTASMEASGAGGGFAFFSPTQQGFPILSVVKDTTKCKPGYLMQTEYDVMFVNKYHAYDEAWLAYIQNQAAMVDPTDFVHLLSYEEGKFYVSQQREAAAATDYNAAGQQQAGVPPVGAPPVGAPPVGGVPGQPPVGAPPAGVPGQYPGVPPAAAPTGVPGQPPVGPPPGQAPMGAPPAGVPGQPPAGPPGAPPAGVPGQPPAGYPAGPPGAPPMGAPPAGVPGQPPAGPPGAPPMGAPPGAPPAGVPGQPPAPQFGGAPVPVQPAPPAQPPAQSPVPTIDPAQGAAPPPDRAPTPPGGDAPPKRSW